MIHIIIANTYTDVTSMLHNYITITGSENIKVLKN